MKKIIIVFFIGLLFYSGCKDKTNRSNYINEVAKMIENSKKLNKILEMHKKIGPSNFISPIEIIKYYNNGDFYRGYQYVNKSIKIKKEYYYFYLYLFKFKELNKIDECFKDISNNFCINRGQPCNINLANSIKDYKLGNYKKAKENIHKFIVKHDNSLYYALFYYLYDIKDFNDIKLMENKLEKIYVKEIFNKELKILDYFLKNKIKKYQYFAIYTADNLFEMGLTNLSDEILNKIIPPYKVFNEYIIIRKIRNLIYEKKYNEAIRLIRENKNKYPENKTFKYYEKYINMHRERG